MVTQSAGNAGLLEHIQNCKKVYYEPLTLEMLDKFFEELRIMPHQEECTYIKDMSRYRKKVAKNDNDEITRAVFTLYAPNKFQLYTMKKLGLNNLFSGNKQRVKHLCSVLNLSELAVLQLQKKYYLGINDKGI